MYGFWRSGKAALPTIDTRLSRNGNEAKTFSRATTGEQRGRLFMLPPW
jgi:hypothetical protein